MGTRARNIVPSSVSTSGTPPSGSVVETNLSGGVPWKKGGRDLSSFTHQPRPCGPTQKANASHPDHKWKERCALQNCLCKSQQLTRRLCEHGGRVWSTCRAFAFILADCDSLASRQSVTLSQQTPPVRVSLALDGFHVSHSTLRDAKRPSLVIAAAASNRKCC